MAKRASRIPYADQHDVVSQIKIEQNISCQIGRLRPLERSSVSDEGKFCWGWIHVVSILTALALHGMLLYVVASQFKKPVPQEKPLTVVVRMGKASPSSESPRLTSGAQQAVTTPPSKPKRLHKSTPPQSERGITTSEIPQSASPSLPDAPLPVIAAASETRTSESSLTPPGLGAGVTVGAELAFFCPLRPAPVYPQVSRKMGEEGTVILHVEWDQEGQITSSRVRTSSGFRRLDEAALAAIHNWRCNPAKQDGLPVRAMAVQAFRFQLQEE